MTGDRELLTLRRKGFRPEGVWIVDGESRSARDWHLHPNSFTKTLQPEIEVAEQDIPEALDLRMCIGLVVHVRADRGRNRAQRLHNALIEARASRVITSVFSGDYRPELLIHGI